MFLAKSLSVYKNPKVQQIMVAHAEDKEVATRFGQGMGKRPDILVYPNDVMELAKKGASSFHCSEENWTNPLSLRPGMKKEELDALRKGWDLILDIDCKIFEYSKIATHYIVKVIQKYGITSVTAKFSGNKGFHIAVPFDSFPKLVGGKKIELLFPDAPQRIAALIKDQITEPVRRALLTLEKNNVERIVEKIQDPNVIVYHEEDGVKIATLNVEPFLAIDTILISSRHLYRMPYSLHEKSGLVSVPVDVSKILKFSKDLAKPENIKFDIPFLDRATAKIDEASVLLRESYDFAPKTVEVMEKKYQEIIIDEDGDPIPETHFPPTIKKMLEGVEDGRKRVLFVLISFLANMNWTKEQVEQRIEKWNNVNDEPLKEVYVNGQLRYYSKKKKMLPPSYENKAYYEDLGVYCGEIEKLNVKNPVLYVKRRKEIIRKEKAAAKRAQKAVKKPKSPKSA